MADPVVALKLIQQDNGRFTQPVPWPTRLTRDREGKVPAQQDDVVSVQPDGRIESRAKDTNGPFELCDRDGIATVYTPDPTVTIVVLPGDLA